MISHLQTLSLAQQSSCSTFSSGLFEVYHSSGDSSDRTAALAKHYFSSANPLPQSLQGGGRLDMFICAAATRVAVVTAAAAKQ